MSGLSFLSAKAATVLCAIGIGFGIGSYLLYKLYCRLFPSDPKDREPVYTADKSCQRDQSNDVSTRKITLLFFLMQEPGMDSVSKSKCYHLVKWV